MVSIWLSAGGQIVGGTSLPSGLCLFVCVLTSADRNGCGCVSLHVHLCANGKLNLNSMNNRKSTHLPPCLFSQASSYNVLCTTVVFCITVFCPPAGLKEVQQRRRKELQMDKWILFVQMWPIICCTHCSMASLLSVLWGKNGIVASHGSFLN